MKKLIFLLILMIGFAKETRAISTELFACPSAYTLKDGNVIGYRLFFDVYLRLGILNFLETEGLVSVFGRYGSLKLVLLKEKKNLPQIAFMLNRGWSMSGSIESTYSINSSGLVFSKKYKDYQVNGSIFKGKTPPIWVGDDAYSRKEYSFHISFEKKLNNLSLVTEFHNFPKIRNIFIGGLIYKTKRFNFKLGHGFVNSKEEDEIEYLFPFLNIEYRI